MPLATRFRQFDVEISTIRQTQTLSTREFPVGPSDADLGHMRVCETRFHGAVQFEAEQALQVPSGLYGFPAETEFLLLEIPSTRPLVFIQSTRSSNLCFLSLPVQVIDQAYQRDLPEGAAEELGYADDHPPEMGKDLLCLALLTSNDRKATTANLQAPIVIDIPRHQGMQVIVPGAYSHQHPLPATVEVGRSC